MLPPPTLIFTIPSIHDDIVLDCRLYHPASLTQTWGRKAAIIAHPYAPLGGCYDDPVVDIVASVILKQGFIVGTFNFRGAGSSKGRTSWTAKPEREDYVSFVGFMAYYLQYLHSFSVLQSPVDTQTEFHSHLTTIPSHALLPARSQSPRRCHTSPVTSSRLVQSTSEDPPGNGKIEAGGLLLLAGYSYGSLITTHLPHTLEILSLFSTPDIGSAASEIRLRAEHLAKQQNELLTTTISPPTTSHRGRHSLQIGDTRLVASLSPGVRIGGEETNPGIRRASQEGRRSLDSTRIRKSFDRVRSISHHNPPVSTRHPSYSSQTLEIVLEPEKTLENLKSMSAKPKIIPLKMEAIEMMKLRTAYLLISPLQGIIKELATMSIFHPFHTAFNPPPKPLPTLLNSTRLHKKSQNPPSFNKLSQTNTLAIFGSSDAFTSSKKLRAWATKLKNQGAQWAIDVGAGGEGMFQWKEVNGAGHFWHEYEHVEILRDDVKRFVRSL